jgi:hypothetical protein
MGVASSLLASYCYDRWKQKKELQPESRIETTLQSPIADPKS